MSGEISRLLRPKVRHGAMWLVPGSVLLMIAIGLANDALRQSNAIAHVRDEIARASAQRQAQEIQPSKAAQEERNPWEVLELELPFPWRKLLKPCP